MILLLGVWYGGMCDGSTVSSAHNTCNTPHNTCSTANSMFSVRAVEHGSESSSGLGELFSKQIGHVPDRHLQFFAKWCRLLSEEEQCCKERDGAPFWLATAAER